MTVHGGVNARKGENLFNIGGVKLVQKILNISMDDPQKIEI